jgi:actin-related protein
MFGTPIVLDIGSGNVKMGFAGEESPSVIIPNYVGRPRKQQQMFITGSKSQFIGEEANAKRSLLSINYPVQRSVVKSWTDLEVCTFFDEG